MNRHVFRRTDRVWATFVLDALQRSLGAGGGKLVRRYAHTARLGSILDLSSQEPDCDGR